MNLRVQYGRTQPLHINLDVNENKAHMFVFDIGRSDYYVHREDFEKGLMSEGSRVGFNIFQNTPSSSVQITVKEGVRIMRLDREDTPFTHMMPVKLKHEILTFVKSKRDWVDKTQRVPYWENRTETPDDFPDNWLRVNTNLSTNINSYVSRWKNVTPMVELLISDVFVKQAHNDMLHNVNLHVNIDGVIDRWCYASADADVSPVVDVDAVRTGTVLKDKRDQLFYKLRDGTIQNTNLRLIESKWGKKWGELIKGNSMPEEVEWFAIANYGTTFHLNPRDYKSAIEVIERNLTTDVYRIKEVNVDKFIEIVNEFFNSSEASLVNPQGSKYFGINVGVEEAIATNIVFDKTTEEDNRSVIMVLDGEVMTVVTPTHRQQMMYGFSLAVLRKLLDDDATKDKICAIAANWALEEEDNFY